ncbi:MAG: hypothetical protein H6738_15230 [Alphaproteobacteria bacterium]|nr:hypothetical protein [Alphaproteobacteria bacterium]MCB9698130.1 hypothetical protein [Alphaproteobacteria bacterium]
MLALLSLVAPALAGEPAYVAAPVTEVDTVLTEEGELSLGLFLELVDSAVIELGDGRRAVLLAPAVLDEGELLLPADAVVDLAGGPGLVAIGITHDHRGIDTVAIGITNDHLGIDQVAIGITNDHRDIEHLGTEEVAALPCDERVVEHTTAGLVVLATR